MKKPIQKNQKSSLEKFKDWFYMITITLLLVFTIESRISLELEVSRLTFNDVKIKNDVFRKATVLDTMEYVDRRLVSRNAHWPLPERLREKDK